MTKRELFLLLLPSVLFIEVAVGSFHFANLLSPNLESTQQNIDALVQKAAHGDFDSKSDRLVGMVTNSWRGRDELKASLSLEEKVAGWTLVLGVVLQVYVILRIRWRMLKPRA
jgi:hypothetical protein